MSDLSDDLCSYFGSEPLTEPRRILKEHGVNAVVRELERLLSTDDLEIIDTTTLFIREAGAFGGDLKEDFCRALDTSVLWEDINRLLLAQNYAQRQYAIRLIDGAGSCRKHQLLEDAFPWFLQNDPINLPGVISTIGWASGEGSAWKYYEAAATANHYLSRWSLCQVMGQFTQQRNLKYLDLLRKDPHPLVAAEASYLYDCNLVESCKKLSKDTKSREMARIKTLEPEFSWLHAHVRFGHIWGRNKTDYTVAEFDRFVREEMRTTSDQK